MDNSEQTLRIVFESTTQLIRCSVEIAKLIERYIENRDSTYKEAVEKEIAKIEETKSILNHSQQKVPIVFSTQQESNLFYNECQKYNVPCLQVAEYNGSYVCCVPIEESKLVGRILRVNNLTTVENSDFSISEDKTNGAEQVVETKSDEVNDEIPYKEVEGMTDEQRASFDEAEKIINFPYEQVNPSIEENLPFDIEQDSGMTDEQRSSFDEAEKLLSEPVAEPTKSELLEPKLPNFAAGERASFDEHFKFIEDSIKLDNAEIAQDVTANLTNKVSKSVQKSL